MTLSQNDFSVVIRATNDEATLTALAGKRSTPTPSAVLWCVGLPTGESRFAFGGEGGQSFLGIV